jgi:sucrose-6-phosphate hydrolase SacC (GH32 family)
MFYAAKTIYDGENRYLVGWIRTKRGRTDDGAWEWGGAMGLPRKIVQDEEGNLFSCFPEAVLKMRGAVSYDLAQPANQPQPLFGTWEALPDKAQRGSNLLYNELRMHCPTPAFEAELTFTLDSSRGNAGFTFFSGSATHSGYEVSIDLHQQMLLFRAHNERFHRFAAQEVLLEFGQPIHMRIIVEGDLIEICVNERFSLSSCFYAQPRPLNCGFYCEETAATLHTLKLYELARLESPAKCIDTEEVMQLQP